MIKDTQTLPKTIYIGVITALIRGKTLEPVMFAVESSSIPTRTLIALWRLLRGGV